MTLGRTVVVPGMIEEYRAFSELLRSLSSDEWQAPSRCVGWTAADVAGHVVGQIADVSVLQLDGIGTPEVTDRQVRERDLVADRNVLVGDGMEVAVVLGDDAQHVGPRGQVLDDDNPDIVLMGVYEQMGCCHMAALTKLRVLNGTQRCRLN